MKLYVQNTTRGLVPLYDEDYDEKRKLTIGETYLVDVRTVRNLGHHNKFFAMIHCAWSYLPEKVKLQFRSTESFREYLLIVAGFCEPFFHPRYGFVEKAMSISFSSMDQSVFEDVYFKVRNVIDTILTSRGYVTQQEFEKRLMSF